MKIIKNSQRITEVTYSLNYYTHATGGWGFDCDKDGNVFVDRFIGRAEALKSYNKCINGEVQLCRPPFVDKRENTYMDWAIGICDDCGKEVHLVPEHGEGIDCSCGAIYTQLGARCRPREQWEERFEDDY